MHSVLANQKKTVHILSSNVPIFVETIPQVLSWQELVTYGSKYYVCVFVCVCVCVCVCLSMHHVCMWVCAYTCDT